ncbi:radical SAM protein [Pseudomaricurvus alkylphenolicus]|uniref:radical SAM protein n=1 Tax=Pseudomaricurvus alkylphenolicus TaxID=1306991 RepID=UPI001423745D|nr:radical SAM protein [Pseudomaricurvus alkylphenolicus]NIB44279.1 radical SAM protein [Pseudomaricurvus alkylphenolicus]
MYPLDYIDPVFRPPSEARSLILQVTNGCSWNKCTFCEMYTQSQKRFRPKPIEELDQQLMQLAQAGYPVRRVFLADGDAMTLSVRRLREILELVKSYYPDVQRISSYCLPRNLKKKSVEELTELRQLGLSMMYVGCESGDDQVLSLVEKGENFASSLEALQKIKAAGMKSSVMILNGLGGEQYSRQHAVNSARLMNAAQPDFLSTLVVSFPAGDQRYQHNFEGRFQPLGQTRLFEEMELLLENLELERTVFRSDHASNYLVLKGILGRDKEALLKQVRLALRQPGRIPLRQEWQRGL